jgi:hypothetical protein
MSKNLNYSHNIDDRISNQNFGTNFYVAGSESAFEMRIQETKIMRIHNTAGDVRRLFVMFSDVGSLVIWRFESGTFRAVGPLVSGTFRDGTFRDRTFWVCSIITLFKDNLENLRKKGNLSS